MVLLWVSVAATALTVMSAQPPSQKSARTVVRFDAALDQIVSNNARLQILKADYFGIAEGPVWIQQGQTGYLLFSDVGANTIYKWTPDGMLSAFLEKSGYTGDLAGIGFQGFGVNKGRLYVHLKSQQGARRGSARLSWRCSEPHEHVQTCERSPFYSGMGEAFQVRERGRHAFTRKPIQASEEHQIKLPHPRIGEHLLKGRTDAVSKTPWCPPTDLASSLAILRSTPRTSSIFASSMEVTRPCGIAMTLLENR